MVCFFILKEMPLYLLNSDTGVILFLQCFIDFVEYKLIGVIAMIITKDVYTAFFKMFKDCCGEYWMKSKNIFYIKNAGVGGYSYSKSLFFAQVRNAPSAGMLQLSFWLYFNLACTTFRPLTSTAPI